jgi:DNA primase
VVFNIEKFLSFHNIPVRLKGENVAKGNINICCPFCIASGHSDNNFHMGIVIEGAQKGTYGCWRKPRVHGGRKIEKLVRILLDCSHEEAQRIVYGEVLVERIDGESMADAFNKVFNKKQEKIETVTAPKELILPTGFIDIRSTGATKKFYDYLASRGFEHVEQLIKKYSLLCCLNDDYRDRIIFPFFFNGELVTWSSRTIDNSERVLRYRDLEVEKSVIHVKRLLYNYDSLISGGNSLFITEGLFDCIKLDYDLPSGSRATCLSTKHMTDEQDLQIRDLIKVFKKVFIFLDKDARSESREIRGQFCNFPNVVFRSLPEGVKDPGNLTKEQVLLL